jgi:hypothetical protein
MRSPEARPLRLALLTTLLGAGAGAATPAQPPPPPPPLPAQEMVAAADRVRNPQHSFRLTDTLVEYRDGKPRDRVVLVVFASVDRDTHQYDNLLGKAQPDVRASAAQLADEADAMARKVLGTDYPRYHAFVLDYAAHNPLGNADCVRTSVLAAWIVEQGDSGPLRAEGTVAQAVGDVSDRIRIYSEQLPAMSLWQAELALERSGFDEASYRNTLRNVDAQLERISTLADTSPQIAHEAMAELRESLRASSDRLDSSWLQTLRTLRAERIALAANIATERESLTSAFDVQRGRLSEDAAKIAANAVETSWIELRKLVREALRLLSLLTVLVLGLPFAAGYLVGRRRSGS